MPKPGITLRQLVLLGARPEDCWEWIGNVHHATGYGKKQYMGETWLAHRWVWSMLMGPIPEGSVIDHRCGNRRCVNPHHLRVTTQAENCRSGAGAQLSADAVRAIKTARSGARWGTAAVLARAHGVSPSLIHDIWNGRAWRDV